MTEQVRLGDVISIDWDGVEAGLKFPKEAEGAAVPAALPLRKTMSEVLAASCDAPWHRLPADRIGAVNRVVTPSRRSSARIF